MKVKKMAQQNKEYKINTARDFYKFMNERRKNVLNRLTKTSTEKDPKLGYIVAWKRRNPFSKEEEEQTYHMAVVTNENPLRVTRDGETREVNRSQSLKEVQGKYGSMEPEGDLKYYIPSKLEKALNKSKETVK